MLLLFLLLCIVVVVAVYCCCLLGVVVLFFLFFFLGGGGGGRFNGYPFHFNNNKTTQIVSSKTRYVFEYNKETVVFSCLCISLLSRDDSFQSKCNTEL